MANIKQVSSLRNYSSVLSEVQPGKPVFLTKNGKGRYVLVDNDEYDYLYNQVYQQLFDEIIQAKTESDEKGWISEEEIIERFGL